MSWSLNRLNHLIVPTYFALSLLPLAATSASAATLYSLRYSDDGLGTRILISEQQREIEADETGTQELDNRIEERSFPQDIIEHQPIGPARIVELRSQNAVALEFEKTKRQLQIPSVETRLRDGQRDSDAADEVVTLIQSGPSANRIDLVFMGDGYTMAEREKFFADIRRMVNDMFVSETFKSYLPLFNVHAVFRASVESGIGRNSRSINTAYKLYREGETLRAIMPGNRTAIRASCAAAPGCDYPIVIANDPEYGGLGGEIAISTSSLTSGTVVLRHELGHNFGEVGEEYDGGGYFGANSASSLRTIGWQHWATQTPIVAEPSKARFLAWPWHKLSNGDYTARFDSDGRYEKIAMNFSASGLGEPGSMRLTLDGTPLPYEALNPQNPARSNDRLFYDVNFDHGFSAGSHELVFSELVHDNNNWVSNLTVHEFGAGYHDDNSFIGAYPVFDEDGSVDGYRPTHEACLMRNMYSTHFCPVCQENNWLQFFANVKLIDSLTSEVVGTNTQVRLATQNLGQLREGGDPTGGQVVIKWFKNSVEVPAFAGLTSWTLPTAEARGTWEARVQYVTPEVRRDTDGLLKDTKTLRL